MHFLVTNFQKSPSAGGFPPPAPIFNIGDLKFRDLAKCGFWSWLWRNRLQNIVMMSFQWRHHHYVTEKRQQNNVIIFFPIWPPSKQNFWLRQWSWVNNLMVFKKSGLGLVTY